MHTKAGASYASLANAVSQAIADAVDSGLVLEDAVSVAIQVAADYWRGMVSDDLESLAKIVLARGEMPLPFGEEEIATRDASHHLMRKSH